MLSNAALEVSIIGTGAGEHARAYYDNYLKQYEEFICLGTRTRNIIVCVKVTQNYQWLESDALRVHVSFNSTTPLHYRDIERPESDGTTTNNFDSWFMWSEEEKTWTRAWLRFLEIGVSSKASHRSGLTSVPS